MEYNECSMDKKLKCVLLVDDDGTTNFINFRILTKLGIAEKIHTEISGEKALNFLQYYAENNDNNSPELIVLDLKMPVMDGFSVLEYLQIKKFANKDKIKIFVLTTSLYEDDLNSLKRFNVEYISKPLTEKKLLNLLETINN
jgi:CheY-like chemotaxis protein